MYCVFWFSIGGGTLPGTLPGTPFRTPFGTPFGREGRRRTGFGTLIGTTPDFWNSCFRGYFCTAVPDLAASCFARLETPAAPAAPAFFALAAAAIGSSQASSTFHRFPVSPLPTTLVSPVDETPVPAPSEGVSLLQASISAGEKGGAARSIGREKPSPLCFAMASCPHTQKSCHPRGEDAVPSRGKTRSSGTATPSKSE